MTASLISFCSVSSGRVW